MNWQTTKPTIRERTKFMPNNDLFSDVKFVVRQSDGESESKQVIPAHKFVLSIGSPVFEAMFYGELAETRGSIELPDCEYENLLELFRYMYSDEANLSGSNVMGVLYLAKKYMVPSLVENCTNYLQDHLDPSNVFNILPSAQKYDEVNLVDQCWKLIDEQTNAAVKSDGFATIDKNLDHLDPSNVFNILPSAQKYEDNNLVDRCWKLIDEQTNAAVKSDGFATIDKNLLEAIVARDTLLIAEIELFKAVELWATKECQRQVLVEADGKDKRRILGEQIVKAIRFPTMTQDDFASVVLDSGILMTDEIVEIVKYFSSVLTSTVGFSETKRCGSLSVQRCCRFNSVYEWCFLLRTYFHCINFSVNKDIYLHGVCIFGIENKTINVDLEVKESARKLVSKSGQFSSALYTLELFSYYGFTVMFDAPIVIKKNAVYHLQAKTTEPSGKKRACGDKGVRSVTCSGVTFTFTDCEGGNGESVLRKQFPELLFTV